VCFAVDDRGLMNRAAAAMVTLQMRSVRIQAVPCCNHMIYALTKSQCRAFQDELARFLVATIGTSSHSTAGESLDRFFAIETAKNPVYRNRPVEQAGAFSHSPLAYSEFDLFFLCCNLISLLLLGAMGEGRCANKSVVVHFCACAAIADSFALRYALKMV
jgi:hypothetical protein